MSDNITNDPAISLRMRALGSDSPVSAGSMAPPASPAGGSNQADQGNDGATNEPDNQIALATENDSEAMDIEQPTFDIRVGRDLDLFSFDYHDIRSESKLIRDLTAATGLELHTTDPEAFSLIHNWFNGHLRIPPFDRSGRDLYMEAARIARGLGLTECESQLIVVVRRAETILSDIINDEIVSGVRMDIDAVKDYVIGELDDYLVRSRNTGGEEEEDTDFEDYDSAPEVFY